MKEEPVRISDDIPDHGWCPGYLQQPPENISHTCSSEFLSSFTFNAISNSILVPVMLNYFIYLHMWFVLVADLI
ncbi:hypothetical protein GBAR_LOCUS17109 [Geodia barretti]|uniref:Uncharacterized protein n=1 Tax=Geodia barretti TaxID=519541 RepID=A0AA35SIP0_GEOBA|nr:hypothetical protein GBAR_LOCUS17109 [Geodia barretti]